MIKIKNSRLRLLGYDILIVSIIAFFVTWLRWYIGFPTSIILLTGYHYARKNIANDNKEFVITRRLLFIICGIMIIWTLLCGVGGLFPQKNDLNIRNAILHDMINFSWPVRYEDGLDSSLTYYIGFWIVPALIGKATAFLFGTQVGWTAANIAYAVYCIIMLCIIILLIVSHLKAFTMKSAIFAVLVLIFFSGMDIIPIILSQITNDYIIIGSHLEWWSGFVQYSSNTTQLGWVYNQAIPAWLVTAMLLHEEGIKNYAFLGLLLLPFGPIPFIGVFIIMIYRGIIEFISNLKSNSVKEFLCHVLSAPNVSAVISVLPIFYLYYSTNAATTSNGYAINNLPFIIYYIFILIEFLFYAILVWQHSYTKRFFLISVLGLLFTPFFMLGGSQDFCMRASIPFLFILMVYIMDYLLANISTAGKGIIQINTGAVILLILLAIGSATPLTEFRQSYTQIVQHKGILADKYGTLNDPNMGRGNFITINASETTFYKYIAKSK